MKMKYFEFTFSDGVWFATAYRGEDDEEIFSAKGTTPAEALRAAADHLEHFPEDWA